MNTKYIIKDWAGNTCFDGIEFDSFDEAWDYIREKTMPEDWQEYVVIQKS